MKLNSKNSSPYHMNHSEDKPVTVSVCFDRCPMSLHQSHSHGQIGGWDGTGFAQDLDAERAIHHLYWWIKWCWLQTVSPGHSFYQWRQWPGDKWTALSPSLWRICHRYIVLPAVLKLIYHYDHQMPTERSITSWCVYVHVLPLVHLLI